jgi:tripartite-type tricarboxylate transporter receptor subunit TctC
MPRRRVSVLCALAAALPCFANAALAQPAEAPFYQGKTITLYIGYPPGGTFDLYARLVARFLGDHIPGKPVILPRNMPGGGTRIAAGYVANVVQPDGLSLGTADSGFALEQATGDAQLQFDTRKLQYIGNPIAVNHVIVTWSASGVHSVDDAKRQAVTMGATGPTSGAQLPRAMNELLGTKFKLVYGYQGTAQQNIAMERGEIQGRGGGDWISWKVTKPDWVAQHKITVITQIGFTREADLPDVPLLIDLASNDEDRTLFRLLSVPVVIGKQLFTSPGVPLDRVAILRKAFDKTMKDPTFLGEAKRSGLDINPVAGEELQRLIADMFDKTPRAVAKRLHGILANTEDTGGR